MCSLLYTFSLGYGDLDGLLKYLVDGMYVQCFLTSFYSDVKVAGRLNWFRGVYSCIGDLEVAHGRGRPSFLMLWVLKFLRLRARTTCLGLDNRLKV
jgi:hypothetical protein